MGPKLPVPVVDDHLRQSHADVNSIVGERVREDGSLEYLVRWKGHTKASDSFVPSKMFSNTDALLKYLADRARREDAPSS